MRQCLLPKDVLFDMEMEGVLPFGQTVQNVPRLQKLENEAQMVKCTREMAEWCRQKARSENDQAQAKRLLNAGATIDKALSSNYQTYSKIF